MFRRAQLSTLILSVILFLPVKTSLAADAAKKPELKIEQATFAGGCFWCMEAPFDKVPGVLSTTSGYSGGDEVNPTYEQVSNGQTGHTESVQIQFDPAKLSYKQLLDVYWKNVDPTTKTGQFCDRGKQYRPAIFTHNAEQMKIAQESKQAVEQTKGFKEPVVVEIVPLKAFYKAEEYHQDFYLKQPDHYTRYRRGCGRDDRLQELWGKSAH